MKYDLATKFPGYATKPDPTNITLPYLVAGSYNVLINDSEKIESRKGYQIDGALDMTAAGIASSYEWDTSSDEDRYLRAGNGKLQLRYDGGWEDLASVTGETLSFAPWWDNTRKIDVLLWVDGTDSLYEWSGAIATFSVSTSNTVTIEGSDTIQSKRFHTSDTRGFRIKDSGGTWREFTYTGGESGTQFTGVSPDPTGFTFDEGAPIFQSVRSNTNTPADGFNADFVTVINNHLVVGSRTSRLIYISKSSSYTDYAFSSPRVPGDGDIVTLDNAGRAAAAIESILLVSAGKDDWYRITFEQITVGTTLSEQVRVQKLKTGSGQAALHHDLVAAIGDKIAFVSYAQELRTLGSEENYTDLQTRSLSNPIKPDFDAEDFTGGHVKAHKNRIYVSAPENGRVYINELSENENGEQRRFWQPPQLLPFSRLAIIEGDLYGHSNSTPETFKLFTGYSDRLDSDGANGVDINCVARFAYRQHGDRANYKGAEYYHSEGYISANTELIVTLNYDYGGATDQKQKTVSGQDQGILFQPQQSNVLGDVPLGDLPLGAEEEASDLFKFIVDHQLDTKPFFEQQAIYSSSGVDQRWQLLAQGPAVHTSNNQPTSIRR